MKKTLRNSVLMVLGLALCAGAAVAGDLAPAPAQTPAPAMTSAVQAPLELELFTPAPQAIAICPKIGCVNEEYCRRDRDCTTAPGGFCNLFCPTQGCCSYPSP
ncbi:MAG TPA: hypothetical protein VJ725_20965 [Thermoanaerobaculia bacterium]|nr:hypothetical protein [Thermoanaerobaculia bacterium]